MSEEVCCSLCGSTQITAQKQGLNAGGAILGEVLLGPLGMIAGAAQGAQEITVTCLGCGHAWKPKEERARKAREVERMKLIRRDPVAGEVLSGDDKPIDHYTRKATDLRSSTMPGRAVDKDEKPGLLGDLLILFLPIPFALLSLSEVRQRQRTFAFSWMVLWIAVWGYVLFLK